MEEYILTETIYHFTKRDIIFYGIALVSYNDKFCELIEECNDISSDKEKIEKLIRECNELKPFSVSLKEITKRIL